MTKRAAVPPTPSASSRDDLDKKRRGVLATGPSGITYRIRQVPIERHALHGGLPAKLRQIAMQGQKALLEASQDESSEISQATLEYLDNLVLAAVIEPALEREDLGDPNELAGDPLVPPSDYRWLVGVATGEEDFDAEGKRLWGLDPLARFATFREEHSCPENCPCCEGARRKLSAPAA